MGTSDWVGQACCSRSYWSPRAAAEATAEAAAKIALLLPENHTPRYESQDRPNFEAKVKELCSDCEILYSNADQDAAKQQQQAEAALTQGAEGAGARPGRRGLGGRHRAAGESSRTCRS